jgi:hypothetical protein
MTELLSLLPIVVPTALLLWLLRDVSSLKTMMATSLQKQLDTESRVQKLETDKHDTRGHLQNLTTRVDLLEWRMQSCDSSRKEED